MAMVALRWFGKQLVCLQLQFVKGLRNFKKTVKDAGRIREKGGGRKSYKVTQAGILEALDNLVVPTSKGDPENPLKWTSKSVRNLAEAMKERGYNIGKTTLGVYASWFRL